jgi:hypothetical protein
MPDRAVDGRLTCSALSVGRREALAATASRVRRWLLVEQPGPWGRDAVVDSRLDHVVGRSLLSHGRRHGARVLLIRRPGWRKPSGPRRVYLVHTGSSARWIEQLDLDEGELAGLDLSVLAAPEPPGVGRTAVAPVQLVCTHGRHDRCCADHGRPVVRALSAAGADVWESSHVGGDRFAANVVDLPSGVYLGRVPADRAASLLADVADGIVDLDHYRGRSCDPPLVQAAEIAARRHLGERRLDALRVESVAPDGENVATCRLEHIGGGALLVTVRRRRGGATRLTCSDGRGRPWIYELVDVADAQ